MTAPRATISYRYLTALLAVSLLSTCGGGGTGDERPAPELVSWMDDFCEARRSLLELPTPPVVPDPTTEAHRQPLLDFLADVDAALATADEAAAALPAPPASAGDNLVESYRADLDEFRSQMAEDAEVSTSFAPGNLAILYQTIGALVVSFSPGGEGLSDYLGGHDDLTAAYEHAPACGEEVERTTTSTTPTTEPPPREGELPVVIESDPLAGGRRLDVLDRVDEAFPPTIPATSVEDIVNEVRRETILMAGIWADTTGSCDGLQLEGGASGTCTVTYAGVPVQWNITVADEPTLPTLPGSQVDSQYSYRTTPDSLVLTADAVYGAAWSQFGDGRTEELRCDRIPDIHVIPRPVSTTYLPDAGYDTGLNCAARRPIDTPDGPSGWQWHWLSIYVTHDVFDAYDAYDVYLDQDSDG